MYITGPRSYTYDIYIFIWLYSYNVVDVSSNAGNVDDSYTYTWYVDDSDITITSTFPAMLETSTSIVNVDVPAFLEDSTGPVNTKKYMINKFELI
jgi:hypothetical protein